MPIYLYNTLTGRKEEFRAVKENTVGIYNCGPTVYDNAHIGNLRTFVFYDIVRRIFEYEGYHVTQVMNITDVDDKTIRRSREEKTSLGKLTRHYETLFLSDIHSMNILTPHRLLRATEYIKEMIEMIANLLEKGIAYPTRDGIYFSIGMFPQYGKLANIKMDAEVRERISNDEYEKENPRDFALWKFWNEDDGETVWETPFGKGRPGWHIECSAMSTWALGPTIDIHAGGTDLIFPHHTNEIAQSEASTGKTFVRYWLHGAHMNVNDEKMAKSKGNFLKLKALESEGISPIAFRYWLLTSHYRSQINFSIEAVKGAQNAFIRFVETFVRFLEIKHEHIHAVSNPRNYKKEFEEKITDDFDMPGAIALAWELIKDYSVEAHEKVKLFLDFDKVFGLGLKEIMNMAKDENEKQKDKKIPKEIKILAETRDEARKNKEWDKADALRKEIESRGYEVKDTEEGSEIEEK